MALVPPTAPIFGVRSKVARTEDPDHPYLITTVFALDTGAEVTTFVNKTTFSVAEMAAPSAQEGSLNSIFADASDALLP